MDQTDAQLLTDGSSDPLLECLVILARLHERPLSAVALSAGLPLVGNRITPALFVRASERVGLSSRVLQRDLGNITQAVLPAVLLLKNDQACVLTAVSEDHHAEVIYPETGYGATRIALQELQTHYSGYIIFAKPLYRADQRSERIAKTPVYSWFWGTLLRYKDEYRNVVIASVLINLFTLTIPLFVMNVYDRVVPNNALLTLWVLAIGALIVLGFDFLMRMLRSYFVDAAGKKADVLMSAYLFQQVMGIRMQERPASAGAFANLLREFETLRDFFTSATLTSMVDLPFVFLFIAIIALIGGPLAFVPLVIIPLVIGVGWLMQKSITHVVEENFHGSAQKHGILVEAIGGLETIKTLSAEGQMQSRWEQAVGMTARSALKSRLLSTLALNFTVFTQQLVSIFVVIGGVYRIQDGLLTVGGLIACTILSGRALAPLGQIAGLLTRYRHSCTALDSLNKIMELPLERPVDKVFLQRPQIKGGIEFDKVSFSYPHQSGQALEGVSFRIQAGEHVAILGRIGSGKSTVLKLIMSLYAPASGSLLVDGTDSAQIDPADLRRSLGYVPQEVRLFRGTVRSNIAMASPLADDAAILRVAQLTGVERFTARHPEGFDMPIGENGEGISGGQRQAISAARALLSDPPVMLLDEPTSAMDQMAEQTFITAMKDYLVGKTLVLVTHKSSMLALVDRLIVLEEGKVLVDGPRDRVLQALSQGQVQGAKSA